MTPLHRSAGAADGDVVCEQLPTLALLEFQSLLEQTHLKYPCNCISLSANACVHTTREISPQWMTVTFSAPI